MDRRILEGSAISFGREETNAQILMGLIKHIVHHRGQVTILMRQESNHLEFMDHQGKLDSCRTRQRQSTTLTVQEDILVILNVHLGLD